MKLVSCKFSNSIELTPATLWQKNEEMTFLVRLGLGLRGMWFIEVDLYVTIGHRIFYHICYLSLCLLIIMSQIKNDKRFIVWFDIFMDILFLLFFPSAEYMDPFHVKGIYRHKMK